MNYLNSDEKFTNKSNKKQVIINLANIERDEENFSSKILSNLL